MSVLRLVFRFDDPRRVPVGHDQIEIVQMTDSNRAFTVAAVLDSERSVPVGWPPAAGILSELASRPGRLVVAWAAEAGGAPVGLVASVVAGTGPTSRRFSLAWLLVSPGARRSGVGTTLVATALADAQARGATEVWVETRSDWAAAVAFWKAVGFRGPP